ncbi:TonB-dependent receptor [Sphingopyxis lindanitolerans]|uniref:TonB-dependent receptor n=1 Tax=Sphingopyxis lindanitolerans TaxID=2054227 RepID=A0A2S8BBA6_9SPHN|nr:TonB-dependent receptor [Sphingopyxis lindanitolerans]PQM29648.1 TonB-dependent receptor [Sphingopyxis lindanitolerans]
MKQLLLATTALLSAGLSAAPLHAQTAPDEQQASADDEKASGIQDIIVTAQRRAESVQDVPIAISAFSSDQLREQGISNTLELGQFVPNLVSMNNTGIGSANAYYLRGLGNTETIATFDPPVGTYVDDIYLSRQNANNLSLFDVERVEVLRGPQGTLFGRNTTGGAINVIMRDPGHDGSGYAEIGYGRFNKRLARGSKDISLADTFAIKLSGYYQNDDGYARNVTTGDRLNDDDGWGIRLGVKGEMAPWARWTGSYAHIAANGENIMNYDCNPGDLSDCKGRFITTGLPAGGSAATSPYAPVQVAGRKANYLQGNRTGTDLITSNLEIDLSSDISLNLITGYVNQVQQYALDFFDGRGAPSLAVPRPPVRGYPRGGFVYLNDGLNQQFTQEIKINGELLNGRINFVTGLYYMDERNKTDYAGVFTLSPALTILLNDDIIRNNTTAYAGYAQADFNITDAITLTAGIRYTDETKSFHVSDNRASCNDGTIEATCLNDANLFGPSGEAIPTSQTTKIWTPRFAVNIKPTEDILLFASATRGFKSGGWNARATTPSQLLPFGPEKVWSYEGGIKSEWFDRKVRVNLTGYWSDVTSLQTPSAFIAPNGSITFITRNFADYRNYGVEGELTFAPTPELNLFANFGYQNDKYIIDRNAPDVDIYGIQSVAAQQRDCLAQLAAGNIPGGPNAGSCAAGIIGPDGNLATPVRTPDWSLALGGSYAFALPSDMTLVPSVNASYRSDFEVSTSNYSLYTGSITGTNGTFPANPYSGDFITGSASQASWLINAGLALNGPDNKWQISANCTNCFNRAFVQTSLANFNYLNPPMSWTIRGRINF